VTPDNSLFCDSNMCPRSLRCPAEQVQASSNETRMVNDRDAAALALSASKPLAIPVITYVCRAIGTWASLSTLSSSLPVKPPRLRILTDLAVSASVLSTNDVMPASSSSPVVMIVADAALVHATA
jgi:hypothetical protein